MAYAAVTLSAFRTRLQERYDSAPFWSDDEADRAINETLRVWNMLTGFWKTRATQATTDDATFYTLPAALTFGARVTYNSLPLGLTSLFGMDNWRPEWRGEATDSGGAVPTTPKRWFPVGVTRYGIWPAHAGGGGTLTIDGLAATPQLSADGDFIDIGEEEHDAILDGTLHNLAFKAGMGILETTFPHYSRFIAAAAGRNDLLRTSSFFRRVLGQDHGRWQRPIRAQGFIDLVLRSVEARKLGGRERERA